MEVYLQDKGNDYILVHGGLAKGKYLRIAPQRDVLLFDLKTQTWTVPRLPFYKGRGCHSVSFNDNKLYVVGGYMKPTLDLKISSGDDVSYLDICI
jgi:hypothetical protein